MKCYIVDAFAEKVFEGNPAGVCILEKALDKELMQSIASENNLSETAFAVKNGDTYDLRWFTPGGEIDLCGHATLATAFVLANFFEKDKTFYSFNTLSGMLTVTKREHLFELDFPVIMTKEYTITQQAIEALGGTPSTALIGRDPVYIFENAEEIENLKPDFGKLKELPDGIAVFVTAKSDDFDFVARAFWPKLNVNEDPVCGSMFCSLTPIWSKALKRADMVARQLSKRGGTVYVKDCGDRVKISGSAALYSIAELQI